MAVELAKAQSAPELKSRIEAERVGDPFLVYRDAAGAQVIRRLAATGNLTVGRGEGVDIDLGFDPKVSRTHAELEPVGGEWALIDDGLSRNGSFANGERVVGRRRLRDGDLLRFGDTEALFRDPREGVRDETIVTRGGAARLELTNRQRRILVALCRPYREGTEFASPATNRQVAEEVHLSIDAVKANLRALFARFDLGDLPQQQKRARLAELALRSGAVSVRDLAGE